MYSEKTKYSPFNCNCNNSWLCTHPADTEHLYHSVAFEFLDVLYFLLLCLGLYRLLRKTCFSFHEKALVVLLYCFFWKNDHWNHFRHWGSIHMDILQQGWLEPWEWIITMLWAVNSLLCGYLSLCKLFHVTCCSFTAKGNRTIATVAARSVYSSSSHK